MGLEIKFHFALILEALLVPQRCRLLEALTRPYALLPPICPLQAEASLVLRESPHEHRIRLARQHLVVCKC